MKKFNHNFYEKSKFNLVSVYKDITLYYAISTNNRTTFATPNHFCNLGGETFF